MQLSPFNLNYLLAIAFSVLSFFALDTTMGVTTDIRTTPGTIVATLPDTSTTQETTNKISTSTDTALETSHDISTSLGTTLTTIVHSSSDTMTTTFVDFLTPTGTMDMASTDTNIVTSSLVIAPSITTPDSSSKLTAIISSPLMTTGSFKSTHSSSTAEVSVALTDNVISPSTVTQDASSIEVATSSIFSVTPPWSAHDATSQSSIATEIVQSPLYTSTFKSSLTNAENDTSTAYPNILSSITITSSVMVTEPLSLMSAHQTSSTAAEITTSPDGAISSTFTLYTSSSYTSDVVSASMSTSYRSDVVSASMSSSYRSDGVSANMSSSYRSDGVSANMSSSYRSDAVSASMSATLSSYTSDVAPASMSSSYTSDVVSASMSSSYTSDVVSASMSSTPAASATSTLTTPTFTGAVTESSTQDITSTTAVNTTTPPVPTTYTTSTTMTSTLFQSTTKYPTTKPNREGVVFVFTFVINADRDTFLNLWNRSLKENMTQAFNTSGLDGFQGVGPALREPASGRKRRQVQGTFEDISMQANFSANVGTTPNLEKHLRDAMTGVENITNGLANLTLQEYETSIGNFVNSTSDVCNSASETGTLCGPLYDCRNNLCYYKCEAKQCGRNGLCYVLQQNAVVVLQCKCTSDDFYDYTGDSCDQKALKTEWVVGITAGVCGLIVLVLVVVFICISCSCCRRSKESLDVDRFEDHMANTSTNNVDVQQIVSRSSFRTTNLPDSHYNQAYQPETSDYYNEKRETKHPYDCCDSSSLASIDTDTKYKIKRPQIVKQRISDQ